MIANALNVVIGLWLSYVAIFETGSAAPAHWVLAVAAFVIFLLALIARNSDYAGWQSATNMVLSILLLIAALVDWTISIPPLVLFWIELCIGLTVASLALWASLYHPEPVK